LVTARVPPFDPSLPSIVIRRVVPPRLARGSFHGLKGNWTMVATGAPPANSSDRGGLRAATSFDAAAWRTFVWPSAAWFIEVGARP
jgi:hypothetical protein